jgi:hypothetical protein
MAWRTVSRALVLAGGLLLAAGFGGRARAQNPPAQRAPPPAVVTGVVVDSAGVPIPHAVVSVLGQPLRVLTDSSGRFRLALVTPGLCVFTVRALGYRPVMRSITPEPGQSASERIVLQTVGVALPEMTVVGQQLVPARLAGFYQRRQLGFGIFLDRDSIEHRPTNQMSDYFFGRPGIRVHQAYNDPFLTRVDFLRCGQIGVYMDGTRVRGDASELLREINPADVEAMEIYTGPSELPAEFMVDDCAAIVIWTRYN